MRKLAGALVRRRLLRQGNRREASFALWSFYICSPVPRGTPRFLLQGVGRRPLLISPLFASQGGERIALLVSLIYGQTVARSGLREMKAAASWGLDITQRQEAAAASESPVGAPEISPGQARGRNPRAALGR